MRKLNLFATLAVAFILTLSLPPSLYSQTNQGGGGGTGATTPNALTFATTGGASPGATFNGSAAITVSPVTIGLGNVTNDAQTKAAIVPNTTPAAGNILVGNAGGTAYASVSASGDATISSAGLFTIVGLDTIPFVNTPFPATGDVVCYDGVQYTPCPPTAGQQVILYDGNAASDITGYDTWSATPTGSQYTIPITITSGSGETLIQAFATASGYPDVTIIPAGEWQADTFIQTSTATATDTLYIDVYKRATNNTETLLFSFGNQIISGGGTGIQSTTADSVQPAITLLTTDRLVVKYSAMTSHAAAVTITLYGGGATNYSHIHTPIGTASAGGGLSGMTAGQVPIAATASTVTSSGPVAADILTYHAPATGIARTTSGGQTVASAELSGDCTTSGSNAVTCALPNMNVINPQTATYQALAADFTNRKTITVASGTFTITLVASGSQPANGQYVQVVNYGSGVVTIARSGQNINGGTASLFLGAGTATAPTDALVWSDGTNYFAASASSASWPIGGVAQSHYINFSGGYGIQTAGNNILQFGTATATIGIGVAVPLYSTGPVASLSTSNCGTLGSKVGGAMAGSFTANATGACTVTVTPGSGVGSSAAANGWACGANDLTTSANLFSQTATTTTTGTISGTAVTGDVINWHCIGY